MFMSVRVAVLALALAGCATGETKLEADALPAKTAGYVAGDFTLKEYPFATAFVLSDVESGREYVLPFTRHRKFPAGHRETSLVELPPGTYRATHWIVFNAFWGPSSGGREFKAQLEPSRFTAPFKLNGGEVVFLGKFLTENQWIPGYSESTTHGKWEAERISTLEARELLLRTYPRFASANMTCIACMN
jgi:hypothetical protein